MARHVESLVRGTSIRHPCDAAAQPYRLVDAAGGDLEAANSFLLELKARGHPDSTLYSYGMALLRWFRFLAAVGIGWD